MSESTSSDLRDATRLAAAEAMRRVEEARVRAIENESRAAAERDRREAADREVAVRMRDEASTAIQHAVEAGLSHYDMEAYLVEYARTAASPAMSAQRGTAMPCAPSDIGWQLRRISEEQKRRQEEQDYRNRMLKELRAQWRQRAAAG